MLLWDDIGTLHNAHADYGPDEHRLIKRCQVMADRIFDPAFVHAAMGAGRERVVSAPTVHPSRSWPGLARPSHEIAESPRGCSWMPGPRPGTNEYGGWQI